MAATETCFLAGIALDLEVLDDDFQKALVKHEFPLRHGALIEDMGRRARSIRVRCYFIGERYSAHRELLAALDSLDAADFQHPVYGLLTVRIESVSVRHDDRLETAEIDLVLVEDGLTEGGQADDSAVAGGEASAEEIGRDGLEEVSESWGDDLRESLGLDGENILSRVLDSGGGVLEQFGDLTGTAREYVGRVDQVVGVFNSTLGDLVLPASSWLSTMTFAQNLPGRVLSAVTGVTGRYGQVFESLLGSPSRFLDSYGRSIGDLIDRVLPVSGGTVSTSTRQTRRPAALAASTHLRTALASTAAIQAGVRTAGVLDRDRRVRREYRRLAAVPSFDRLGRYAGSGARRTAEDTATRAVAEPGDSGSRTAAPLTVREIESALVTVRSMLQESVDAKRQAKAPNKLAALLVEQAKEAKADGERLINIRLDGPTPLHRICLNSGLTCRDAERLLAVNRIPRPNRTEGSLDVFAR